MEKIQIKQNENGRSMVEMLGVLAVVGVLSIGGVAGYRYAVDKMNANEIINELKKRAITASQQRVLGQNVNLAEYGNILGKYAVDIPTDGYPNNPSAFALEVKDVPEGVCNHILRSDWALPVEKKVGGTVVNNDTSCSDGANILTFAFNNTLDGGELENAETPELTTAVTSEVTTESQIKQQICDEYNNCYDCSYDGGYIAVNNASECSRCDGTGNIWVFGYHGADYKAGSCFKCDSDGFSDHEDNVEESCGKCGLGVNWNVYDDFGEGWRWYSCATTSKDIGIKPERVTEPDETATETEVTDTELTATESTTEVTESGEDDVCSGHGDWIDEGRGYCLCDKGWSSEFFMAEPKCEVFHDACNGHGRWMGCGCFCDAGWSSISYDMGCTENIDVCNGHGRSFGFHHYGCLCDAGWSGENCTENVNKCNGQEKYSESWGCINIDF